jgi:hypothetical protein
MLLFLFFVGLILLGRWIDAPKRRPVPVREDRYQVLFEEPRRRQW